MFCEFSIVLPVVTVQYERDPTDSSLIDAVQTAYDIYDCDLRMKIGTHEFSLGMKYDIGMMVDDIVELVQSVLDNECGQASVAWVSNTFPYMWTLTWNVDSISLSSAPHHLAEPNWEGYFEVTLRRQTFVEEWIKLLKAVTSVLEGSGYFLGDLRLGTELLRIVQHGSANGWTG